MSGNSLGQDEDWFPCTFDWFPCSCDWFPCTFAWLIGSHAPMHPCTHKTKPTCSHIATQGDSTQFLFPATKPTLFHVLCYASHCQIWFSPLAEPMAIFALRGYIAGGGVEVCGRGLGGGESVSLTQGASLYPHPERGQSISPIKKQQIHVEKSSQIAPSHPPTHPSVCKHYNLGRAKRGVQSTAKTGVEIRSGQKKMPSTPGARCYCLKKGF